MTAAMSAYGIWWECPCGTEPPKRGRTATPVRTVVSLMQPACPFCGRAYQPEYRRTAEKP